MMLYLTHKISSKAIIIHHFLRDQLDRLLEHDLLSVRLASASAPNESCPMRHCLLGVFLLVMPELARADGIKEGFYRLTVDGGEGSMLIEGGTANLTVVAQGTCSGSAMGAFEETGDRRWKFTDSQFGTDCTVEIKVDSDGIPQSISEFGSCHIYHGASCGFDGTVSGLDVPFDIAAVDAAFQEISPTQRLKLQEVLAKRGIYKGGIDGTTGPATRLAIRSSARDDLSKDPTISLSTASAASAYISSLISMSDPPTAISQTAATSPSPAQTKFDGDSGASDSNLVLPTGLNALIGKWTCPTDLFDTAAEFEFSDSYAVFHNLGIKQIYDQVQPLGNRGNALSIEFQSGDVLGVFDIQRNSIILMANQMIFDCRR